MSLVSSWRTNSGNWDELWGFTERRTTSATVEGRSMEGSRQQVETLGLSLPADAASKERADCVLSNPERKVHTQSEGGKILVATSKTNK